MPTVCGSCDAVLERAAALVVDQHERHLVRPVGDRQRGDDRLQQLGLARPGGPGDQPVRAVPAQVDAERAVVGLADHRQRGPAAGAASGPRSPRGVRRLEAEHVEQPGRLRQPGAVVVVADVPDRGDRPGQPGAPAGADVVRPDLPDSVAAIICCTRSPSALGHGHRLALGGQQPLVGVQADRVHADRRALAQHLDRRRAASAAGATRRRRPRCRSGTGPGPASGVALAPSAGSAMIASSSAIRVATDLRVVADQHGAVLPRQRAGSAAASAPTPSSSCPAESVSTQICRSLGLCRAAVWATSQRPTARGVSAGPGHADHAALGQRHGDRGVRDLPERPACGARPGSGSVSSTADGRSAVPEPQQQVVGVGAAALPQPAPRARWRSTARRPGRGSRARRASRSASSASARVALDPGLVLAVLGHPLRRRTCGRACAR